ncbi:probable G-protein coupled receptor 132b [Triplophysa rosa]|uniref:G protein-coupled receptor 132b n=1 Tax=Triplophysa rosa TaxID=992332 RepID=A0A9W7WHQ7_TRIRA|nr:probable G-protein coupled receptor 132b [Triplophysa rosa]KAI7799804.1 G protein-coupled receptor 132b [Triplophysa rosa]
MMHESSATQSIMTTMNQSVIMPCEVPYMEDRIPLLVLYIMVFIIGLPANLVTVYLTFHQVCRKNFLGIYLLSLSVCDLTYLFTLPVWAVYVNENHVWPWSSMACKVTGFVFFNNMYISIFLLCCISIDRYVAVVHAIESRGLRHKRVAALIVFSVYLVVGLGHLPVFMMREGDAAEGSRRCFEPGQNTATVTGFNYARFCIGFCGPLAILIFTNRAILTNVQASTGLQPHQKVKVRYLAVAVVALFLICFAPYHIILLIRAVTYHFPELQKECHFEHHVYTPYQISLGLSTVNSAINPFLYVLSSNNIHEEVRKSMAEMCSKITLIPPSTHSSQHNMHSSKSNSGPALTKEDEMRTASPVSG